MSAKGRRTQEHDETEFNHSKNTNLSSHEIRLRKEGSVPIRISPFHSVQGDSTLNLKLTKNVEELQTAVEKLHDCVAEFVSAENVEEVYQGKVVWSGDVATFALTDHPSTTTAYVWKELNAETGKDRFFAVLQSGPVDSPNAAIRASIMKDFQEGAN